MEAIFEAITQIIIEIIFEMVGEVVGGIFEYVFSSDFLTFLNRKVPTANGFSNEIITLDILDYKKEIF